jgi:hypothetical protein
LELGELLACAGEVRFEPGLLGFVGDGGERVRD